MGEDIPVAEALAVLQVRALDLFLPAEEEEEEPVITRRRARGHRDHRYVKRSYCNEKPHLVSRRAGAEEEPGRELAPVDSVRGRHERRRSSHGHDPRRNAPDRLGHLARARPSHTRSRSVGGFKCVWQNNRKGNGARQLGFLTRFSAAVSCLFSAPRLFNRLASRGRGRRHGRPVRTRFGTLVLQSCFL